ncbi:DUF6509 family protein [Planomicrobium okeanokoites]|uniref:DUF6509 family protein n=1 Tax=Planomicrobium okeanokoites TaxID=244 RepID=A0ABV7KJI4_PLAOK|nr:DUF6509 family protein [Planomicrobium okeanokoites]TAA68980.1 pullulanase [Planomicrobium okeanokoites]
MEIIDFTFHKINDPTGIMESDRYEFLLTVEVDEDDELYTEAGLDLRVIMAADESGARIAHYNFMDKQTGKAMEFALEDDEEAEVQAYCRDKLSL